MTLGQFLSDGPTLDELRSVDNLGDTLLKGNPSRLHSVSYTHLTLPTTPYV